MRINVTTTIGLDKAEGEKFTQKEIDNVYEMFREIISEIYRSGDVTGFVFFDADTLEELEEE